MKTLEVIGRGWMEGLKNFHDTLSVLGETSCEILALPFHPGRFRFRDFLVAFQRAAFDGLPIYTGIGFLLGLILAFESAAALQTFGVESYVEA